MGSGLKGLLGGNKPAAAEGPGAPGAEQGPPKAGRFASLRGKMSKSSDANKVSSQQNMILVVAVSCIAAR